MMTTLVCPDCGRELTIKGEEAQCHHCGLSFALTTEEPSESPQAEPVAPPAAKMKAPTIMSNSDVEPTMSALARDPVKKGSDSGEQTIAWEGESDSSSDMQHVLGFLAPAEGPDELGRLGTYRIIKVLGVGGMGVVFHAEDVMLRREVALKAMLPGVAMRTVNRQRFLREAQAAAAVRHPNVITIYQVGEDRGIPYFAMEYLIGEALDERLLRVGRLPILDTVRIARETAEGLAAAHVCNLVHRDVKPANLWLTHPGDRVVLLDFGLARVTGDETHLTQSGVVVGTPAYMSPEQARGHPLDARSDLFSFGVLLYRMCTGVLPFHGSDTIAMLGSVVNDEPRPFWELVPDLPWSLGKLLTQLLAKDPQERPASAVEVAKNLVGIEAELMTLGGLLSGSAGTGNSKGSSGLFDSDTDHVLSEAEGGEDEIVEEVEEVEEVEVLEVVEDEAPAKSLDAPLLPADRLHELEGHTLGSYELGPVLGVGSYGVVFKASDQRNGNVVALKVLSSEFPHHERETQRFSEVLRSRMSLRHPNLVTLQAVGRNRPYCWIASEYVESKSLRAVLKETNGVSKNAWRTAFRVAVHIGRALEYTSRFRITHGNITPWNILIRTADQVAMLNDLMIENALRGSLLQMNVLDEKLKSERMYLAPEQVDSERSFVDCVCDLYGLGVVLYVMITGKPLFRSDSLEEAVAKIRGEAPTRPRKYQKSIPREFEWAVLRMLAKRQEDRYQSASELIADLRPVGKVYGLEV